MSCSAYPILPFLFCLSWSVLSVSYCMSHSACSALPVLCVFLLSWLCWLSWSVLEDLFRHSIPDKPALAILSCLSSSAYICSACPVLPIHLCLSRSVCLSCLSQSAFPIRPVPFCLSALPVRSACTVPFCLSCSGCPILAVLC
jgi:hypothetical protein